MNKHLLWNSQSILALKSSLQQGKISLTTTDTVLGLLASCTKEGFDALNTIKGRQQKPYLVLVADAYMAQNLIAESHYTLLSTFVATCWPGPITVIFPIGKNVPLYMQSKDRTIAIRIPSHKHLLGLLHAVGPLFSTSANLTGEPVPLDKAEVNPHLLNHLDYVVFEDQAKQHSSVASTIIDCSSDEIRLIREGAFAVDQIEHKAKLTIKR